MGSVRQRTIGSPARDYLPALRGALQVRQTACNLFGVKEWAMDEKAESAREYRRKQQDYINRMLGELKGRIESGNVTPSILGNMLRQGTLKEEEVLLASYTGSMFPPQLPSHWFAGLLIQPTTVAAGVNLGYSLTWIIGYLASRPDLQAKGFEAISEVYGGEPPKPHEYDRVEYVKALHTVSELVLSATSTRL